MNASIAERLAAALAAAAVTFALLIAVVAEAGAGPHERAGPLPNARAPARSAGDSANARFVDAERGAPCAARTS